MQSVLARFRHFLPIALALHFERLAERNLEERMLRDSAKLKQMEQRLHACASVEDYLAFAQDVFQLNQKALEITSLVDLLRAEQPVCVAEIGSYRCGNLFLLRSTVSSITTFISVDRVIRQGRVLRKLTRDENCFRFIEGDSRAARTVSAFREHLGPAKLDFLFIDGDHSYRGVKSDYLQYREFVKEGGLIAFHDIVPDLTTRMKSDVPLSKCYAGEVPAFWAEIKQQFPAQEFIENAGQDGFGIGVIRYSPSRRERGMRGMWPMTSR